MPDSITIILDLPAPELSQNYRRGGHWSHKSEAVKAYRDATHVACLEVGKPASCPWSRATVSMMFHFPADKRRRDLLNYLAATKAGIDGIQDAGVIVDDSGLDIGRIGRGEPDSESPRVVVHIERSEP